MDCEIHKLLLDSVLYGASDAPKKVGGPADVEASDICLNILAAIARQGACLASGCVGPCPRRRPLTTFWP